MGKAPAIALGCVAAVVACVGCAVLSAVVIAIVELYLAGHSLPTLSRPWIDHGPFRFSRADALMYACALSGAALAGTVVARALGWSRSGR
jgi:hypothetical protein